MNIYKLLFIGLLFLFCLNTIDAQKRYTVSGGMEIELLPDELLRPSVLHKKQFRFEFESSLNERFYLNTGLRFSWTSEEFHRFFASSFSNPQPRYAFYRYTLALPFGVSYNLKKDSVFPIAVYANIEPSVHGKFYTDYYDDGYKGDNFSLSLESGLRLPFYSGEKIAVFFSPYYRLQSRKLEDRISETDIEKEQFKTTLMGVVGLRLGVSLY